MEGCGVVYCGLVYEKNPNKQIPNHKQYPISNKQ